ALMSPRVATQEFSQGLGIAAPCDECDDVPKDLHSFVVEIFRLRHIVPIPTTILAYPVMTMKYQVHDPGQERKGRAGQIAGTTTPSYLIPHYNAGQLNFDSPSLPRADVFTRA